MPPTKILKPGAQQASLRNALSGSLQDRVEAFQLMNLTAKEDDWLQTCQYAAKLDLMSGSVRFQSIGHANCLVICFVSAIEKLYFFSTMSLLHHQKMLQMSRTF